MKSVGHREVISRGRDGTPSQNPVIEAIPAENQLKAEAAALDLNLAVGTSLATPSNAINDAEWSTIHCNFMNFVS